MNINVILKLTPLPPFSTMTKLLLFFLSFFSPSFDGTRIPGTCHILESGEFPLSFNVEPLSNPTPTALKFSTHSFASSGVRHASLNVFIS